MVQQWKCNLVTRMRPRTLVSNNPLRFPSIDLRGRAMSALLMRTSKRSSRVVDDAESVSDRRVVTHVQLVELATERGCCRYS